MISRRVEKDVAALCNVEYLDKCCARVDNVHERCDFDFRSLWLIVGAEILLDVWPHRIKSIFVEQMCPSVVSRLLLRRADRLSGCFSPPE